MRITIDTQQDSHAEIRKAIKLLQNLVGESHVYTNEPSPVKNIFDSPSPTVSSEPESAAPAPAPTNAFADMFGDDSPSEEQTSQVVEVDEAKTNKDDLVEFY